MANRAKMAHGGRSWHLGTKEGSPALCGFKPNPRWTHDFKVRSTFADFVTEHENDPLYTTSVCAACKKKAGLNGC